MTVKSYEPWAEEGEESRCHGEAKTQGGDCAARPGWESQQTLPCPALGRLSVPGPPKEGPRSHSARCASKDVRWGCEARRGRQGRRRKWEGCAVGNSDHSAGLFTPTTGQSGDKRWENVCPRRGPGGPGGSQASSREHPSPFILRSAGKLMWSFQEAKSPLRDRGDEERGAHGDRRHRVGAEVTEPQGTREHGSQRAPSVPRAPGRAALSRRPKVSPEE